MKIRILLVLVVIAGVTTGAVLWRKRNAGDGGRNGTTTFYGNVDIREAHLGFRVAGRIKAVLKDEGDFVQAGEVLAQLDDEPYRNEFGEAQAKAAAARARLAMLKAGVRTQEIAQAHAVLREREVSAANARRIYKRQEELLAANTVSQQERDDAESRFREAEARLASAREQLNLLESGFRAEEIEQAEAELRRAEFAASLARTRLEDTELRAPADGVVLTRAQEPGAVVQPGATVVTLTLTRPVWVRAYAPEPLLGKVKPGARANVFTDSRKDRPYIGQIGYVSPRSEFTPKNVETTELRTSLVYRFRVTVEQPDDALRQGMPVTVQLSE